MIPIAKALFAAMLLLAPARAIAGPVEDAHAALDGWAAAFTSNDLDGVVKSYWPDATMLGRGGPFMPKGADAIRRYYTTLMGERVQARIGARHTIALGAGAVMIAGFCEFLRMKDGKPVSTPMGFTALLTKRGGGWRIAHHQLTLYDETKQ